MCVSQIALSLVRVYARSWLDSVTAAGISFYIVGAMDAETSWALPSMMPDSQCFNYYNTSQAPAAGTRFVLPIGTKIQRPKRIAHGLCLLAQLHESN